MLMIPVLVFAQDSIPPKNWKWTGLTAINLNQAAFSNWTAGGTNSVAFSALENTPVIMRKTNSPGTIT